MTTNDKQYYITIDNQEIPVSEEIYRAFKQPLWAERKREDREKRCIGAGGHRCMNDCSECPHLRNGKPLSLEKMQEDYNYDLPASIDIPDLIAYQILLEELAKVLAELSDEDRIIATMISQGKSERDIAAVLNIPRTTLSYRKNILLDQLKKQLEDFK